jgi:hypothetical protein
LVTIILTSKLQTSLATENNSKKTLWVRFKRWFDIRLAISFKLLHVLFFIFDRNLFHTIETEFEYVLEDGNTEKIHYANTIELGMVMLQTCSLSNEHKWRKLVLLF